MAGRPFRWRFRNGIVVVPDGSSGRQVLEVDLGWIDRWLRVKAFDPAAPSHSPKVIGVSKSTFTTSGSGGELGAAGGAGAALGGPNAGDLGSGPPQAPRSATRTKPREWARMGERSLPTSGCRQGARDLEIRASDDRIAER